MHAREWSGFLVSLDIYRVDATVLRNSTGTAQKFSEILHCIITATVRQNPSLRPPSVDVFEDERSLADRVLDDGDLRRARPVGIQLHQLPRTQQRCSDTWQVEVGCSGADSEMILGNDILRLEN